MAHFIGEVYGNGKPVSRLGSKKSGISVVAATYTAKVHTRLWHDSVGVDNVHIYVMDDTGRITDVYWGPLAALLADAGDPDLMVKNYMRRQLTGEKHD